MNEFQIRVANVKCGGCVNNITTNLSNLAGIESVTVDIPTGLVTIQAEQPDLAMIKQKLTDLGYPPVENG